MDLMVQKYRFAKDLSKKLMIFGSNRKKGGVPSLSWKLSKAPQKSVEIKICHFLFQSNILGWLGQDGLIKNFLLGFLWIPKKR